MIIVKNETTTKYICSICGYEHVINADGSTSGQPFPEYERKIKSYKFREEDTCSGRQNVAHLFEYRGYTCPKCGKLQVTEKDARDISITTF